MMVRRSTAARAALFALVGALALAVGADAQTSKPAAGKDKAGASAKKKEVAATIPVKPKTAPERIQVQHLLIAFDGSLPGQKVGRTKDEAKKLAYELLDQARQGADFDSLVKKHTNDSFPGIYAMTNFKVAPDKTKGEYAREGMVPAFGDVGFNISPGNIDIADFDPQKSPYGWHIIKRVK